MGHKVSVFAIFQIVEATIIMHVEYIGPKTKLSHCRSKMQNLGLLDIQFDIFPLSI